MKKNIVILFHVILFMMLYLLGGTLSGDTSLHAQNAQNRVVPNPLLLGQFDYWTAYSFQTENNKTICYVLSLPVGKKYYQCREGQEPNSDCPELESKPLGRGFTYILVTHHPENENSYIKNVPSFATGHILKPKSEVKVFVHSENFETQSFDLFTDEDTAWTYNKEQDENLTDVIRLRKTMEVHSISETGIYTIDTYNLKGSLKALDKIEEACPTPP